MVDSPEGFSVQRALMRALILTLKTSQPSESVAIGNSITWCLQYTATVELRFRSVPLKEMEEIMSAATELCKRSASQSADQIENEMVTQISKYGESAFLLYAAQYNLQSFIQNKLENGVLFLPGQATRTPLSYVVGSYMAFPSLCERSEAKDEPVPNLALIRRLLDLGNNPNESFDGKTSWECVLFGARRIAHDEASSEKRKRLLLHWAKIIDEFIKHDVDPYAIKDGASANAIREAFGQDLPKIARAFEDKLSKSQQAWGRLGKFLIKSTNSSKPAHDMTGLFRQIQLENAQIPGLSVREYFMQPDQDRKSNSGGILDGLKRFEPAR